MTKVDDKRRASLAANGSPVPAAVNALPGYLILYIALYLAYGTESAYLPAFLGDHGLSIEQIGLVLAAGTIVRIVAGSITGRLADHLDAGKQVLSVAAFSSGLIGFTYNLAFGFAPLMTVSMARAAVTASLAPLSDALSVAASMKDADFSTVGCAAPALLPLSAAP
jgi:PPP family 3-phenylpropionic acid transporter